MNVPKWDAYKLTPEEKEYAEQIKEEDLARLSKFNNPRRIKPPQTEI